VTDEGYTLRAGTPEDFDEIWRVVIGAFNEDPEEDAREVERLVYEPERTILTVADDQVAGVASAFTRELSVPGAVIPAAHVTMVGVEATHRRRGVLTRMMHHQLADVRARGEAVAVLWASEGRIYQRYGYGMAAQRLLIEAEREVQLRAAPGPAAGRLRAAVPAAVAQELQKVYEQVFADRTGWSGRDSRWWDYVLADPSSQRGGATALRVIIHDPGTGADGYALWRVKNEAIPGGGKNTVVIREVVAANPRAYQALWHFLLNVDLTRETRFPFAAVDEPLLHSVNEPRRLHGRVMDSLWVRLTDVPAALSARRYAAPVDVVIEVTDPVLPENSGAWHLVADPDSASCRPAERGADLRCDLGALGAAYLGGSSLAALAAAGRVHELTPGTLGRAAAAFGWYRAPSATEVF
jgi:predicted acetyltransferase